MNSALSLGRFLLRLVRAAVMLYVFYIAWGILNFTDGPQPAGYVWGLGLIWAACIAWLLLPVFRKGQNGEALLPGKVPDAGPIKKFENFLPKLAILLVVVGLVALIILTS